MPHVSDVRPTSHDRHDPILVAALAADDLTGIDRDQAIAQTRSCAECATLRDDLVALARATASAPPPFATPPRDFRLTPADAARLRPTGWRRFVAALSMPRSAATRPLGVGLATLGLVGLLVGNVQLGSSAGVPQGASTTAGSLAAPLPNADMVQVPSAGAAAGQVPAAAASAAPATGSSSEIYGGAVASSLPDMSRGAPITAADSSGKAAATEMLPGDAQAGRDAVVGEPFRPLNVLFGAAVVVGIGLLVGSRLRGRRPV
ncbi:MAG TPA: hypothetical protein VHM48_09785 [Candidatus Limnocylindrales bacterium]|nr:hypothetical protein [Candidatus Limnocylindrales bacterium]